MADVNAFISYARSDAIIAETIDRELGSLASSRLECFLDTKSINGEKWEPLLIGALKTADWLLCVFTGDQSEYCGFEMGVFSTANGLINGDKSDKRVVCLHDVSQETVPNFLQQYSGIRITFPDEDQAVCASPAVEESAWYNTAIAQFLRDFCDYRKLYTEDLKYIDRYKKRISDAAKAISQSFRLAKGNDLKDSTACQTMMDVHIPASVQKLEEIPETAFVTGDAFPILGLMPSTSVDGAGTSFSWTELKSKLKPALRAEAPWIERMQEDIICAAAMRQVSGDDITFTGSDGKIYRPILARHDLYMSGKRTFRILFIETLNREFLGRPQTSALLISLVMASRFYFKYFECGQEGLVGFAKEIGDDDFQDNCRQLCYDLDRMEQEAVEYGIGEPRVMVDAFGLDHKVRVERFFTDWEEARTKLFATLSHDRQPLTADRRREMKQAVDAFFTAVRKQNADFLKLAIERYRDEILGHLGRTGTVDRRADMLADAPDPQTVTPVVDPRARRTSKRIPAEDRQAGRSTTAARAPKSTQRRAKNGSGEAPSATS